MRAKRLRPDERRKEILKASIPLAEIWGYDKMTRKKIAEAAGVSEPIVNYHFGKMENFKKALVQYAIKEKILKVVAQAVIKGVKVPEKLRRQALDSLR